MRNITAVDLCVSDQSDSDDDDDSIDLTEGPLFIKNLFISYNTDAKGTVGKEAPMASLDTRVSSWLEEQRSRREGSISSYNSNEGWEPASPRSVCSDEELDCIGNEIPSSADSMHNDKEFSFLITYSPNQKRVQVLKKNEKM